jgi:two-component system NarL family response regulator
MKRSSKPRNPSSASTLSPADDGGKNSPAHKIRILIADDHTTVLAGLASIIGMQPDMLVVAEAVNGREAVDLWQKHRPDVTLLDLRMPKLDGVSVINEIRQHNASARIIILTTYDTDNEIYRAIKAGAKGYLLKDARREELLDCIRKVNGGDTCIPQALVEKLAAGMTSEILTGRELGVLALLARGKSNKEIGANLFISETTVKGHLRSIFTKLNVLSRTEAIAVASRRGLVQL